MNYIKFSHEYPKLRETIFPTIRRYDRYPSPGTIMTVKTPLETFKATLIEKWKMPLNRISPHFLCYDSNTVTREEAIKRFNSFYRKPLAEDEMLTVLWFRKILVREEPQE